MASFMRTAGVAQIVGGLLLGLLFGNLDGYPLFGGEGQFVSGFRWSVAFACWVAGCVGGIAFVAIGELMDSMQRVEENVYRLSIAYFEQNPNAAKQPKPLGSSRSSLDKLSKYRMGKSKDE
ncbi:hypothetical protein [Paenibacillus koleovorans]|uniref:hypothetical protein n=1 Tax=Paenibacillus koleovorans TaxID=121608 RepID=UPI000FD6CCB5|nr:hypothetical protein [Paenibacillus koleovorans]